LTEAQYRKLAEELQVAYTKPQSEWPKPTLAKGVEFHEITKLPPVQFPADNPYSKEKEALGKLLFFDPRLSGSGQISCASCHDPDLAWADGRTVSFGHNRKALKRNAPSIQFAAFSKSLFWDGRAADLEDQFSGPVLAHDEMNGDAEAIVQRLESVPEYRLRFKEVFGAEKLTLQDAAKAVATFERTIAQLGGRSAYDKFLEGKSNALSDSALRGLHIFRTSGRCLNCHNGPAFSDGQFHDLGFSFYQRTLEDLGRYNVTKEAADVGRFRTPTVRNVGRTRPYMHNGLLDLEGVINAYNAGMATLMPRTEAQKNDPLFPKKDNLLVPLGLTLQERTDLKEFLESLNEPPLRIRPPALPGEVAVGPATTAARSAAQTSEKK
jgi:cytochrome c peroxidase